MSARLFIAIPVHGRLALARECIKTVDDSRDSFDTLAVYADGEESRYDMGQFDELHVAPEPIGIERQRRQHFVEFQHAIERGDNFSHLYLTDADAPHDPHWRSELLRLSEKYDAGVTCGYNTQAHERLEGNTISVEDDIIWRRVAPGISYLLRREDALEVARVFATMPDPLHWDWSAPAILGHRCAVSRVSYVDHIGIGGLHHPAAEGADGGDRALSPTCFLQQRRAEIVAALSR